MPSINKRLLRLAVAIHAELGSHRNRSQAVELPTCSWDCCAQLVRQIRRAEFWGWHLAAEELRRDLGHTIPTLQAELASIASQLPRSTISQKMASVGDIYDDLLALEMDFDDIEYDIRGRWLSVTTEPITLENIYLGPFEIQLNWGRAAGESAYRVIATDPHPAESRENVTHPHVMDEILCEGHSRQAIRQALVQGRLLDFFTLVANGLRTYNEESPFVALEIWYGSTCSDCGAVMDEDDRYVCQRCEEAICEGCATTCAGCDDSCCSQCSAGCEVCDDNFCRGCLRTCRDCQQSVCFGCLATIEVEPTQAVGKSLAQPVLHYPVGATVQPSMLRELAQRQIRTLSVSDERCVTCHEKERTNETSTPPDGAAVQPHGLGQALVPA